MKSKELKIGEEIRIRCVETKSYGIECCNKCVLGQQLRECKYECRAMFRIYGKNVCFVTVEDKSEIIDETKLDELARTEYQNKKWLEFPTDDRVRYYKAGYRKAKEE